MARATKLTLAEKQEIARRLWDGEPVSKIAEALGRPMRAVHKVGTRRGWVDLASWQRSPTRLSIFEREEISRGLKAGESYAEIARGIGRHRSTVLREVAANGGRRHYRALAAGRAAWDRTRRPKTRKLERSPRLRDEVEAGLEKHWSPEQIARRLVEEFPDDLEMRVSHETIYQALFVQGKGALSKELASCLRSGRAVRRPRSRRKAGAGKIPGMVMISERPPEVEDRAVPGHWEGDLITGAANRSAIGTLVERSTRYLMLLHLPEDHTAEKVREAIAKAIGRLPAELRKTLTWDQGSEMAQHVRFSVESGVDVYFCDPHSPWQRGTNENTNGLLRQYFPKGTDLSVYSQEYLDAVAREMNDRPRKTLGWKKPAEKLAELVAMVA